MIEAAKVNSEFGFDSGYDTYDWYLKVGPLRVTSRPP